MKKQAKSNFARNFMFIIVGILVLGGFAFADTIITNNGIILTGNITASSALLNSFNWNNITPSTMPADCSADQYAYGFDNSGNLNCRSDQTGGGGGQISNSSLSSVLNTSYMRFGFDNQTRLSINNITDFLYNYNQSSSSSGFNDTKTATYIVSNVASEGQFTSIQAAINAAPTGSTIHIKNGTYTITSTINLSKDISIEGEGYAGSGGTTIQFDGNAIPEAFEISSSAQEVISIKNLRIDSSSPGNGTAINASLFIVGRLQDLWISDVKTGIDMQGVGTYYNIVDNVRIEVEGPNSTGIIVNATANENTFIRSRIVTSVNSVGIYCGAHGNEFISMSVETNAFIGARLGEVCHDSTWVGTYLEGNQQNMVIDSGVEATVLDGGVFIDADDTATGNLVDNGKGTLQLNIRKQYEPTGIILGWNMTAHGLTLNNTGIGTTIFNIYSQDGDNLQFAKTNTTTTLSTTGSPLELKSSDGRLFLNTGGNNNTIILRDSNANDFQIQARFNSMMFRDENANRELMNLSTRGLFLNAISNFTMGGGWINVVSNANSSTQPVSGKWVFNESTYAGNGMVIVSDYASPEGASENLVTIATTNTGWGRPLLRINDNTTLGGGASIRMDGPNPDIEFIETDQTSPNGKFEIAVQGDKWQLNSRNAADNSFDNFMSVAQKDDVGGSTALIELKINETNSNNIFLKLSNHASSAGALSSITWNNTLASANTAQISAKTGASNVAYFGIFLSNITASVERFNITGVTGEVSISNLTGSGNDFVCVDANGRLFRAAATCDI